MDYQSTKIIIGKQTMTIEFGHTIDEFDIMAEDAEDNELWDFSVEDMLTGAVDVDEDIIYWYIDGRFYETL